LSIMVRPDNGGDRMLLVVLAPGHEFRHGAAAGLARVRVADVGGEAFQEPERGPIAGGGDRGRHGVGLMGAHVGVEYDGEPRGHQRWRRMLAGGTGG
jgi:hypothetical protein